MLSLMEHQTLWERVADVLSKLGGFIAALTAAFGVSWGAIKGLPRLFNFAKIQFELTAALEGQRIAERIATQYREAAADYRQLYEDSIHRTNEAVERAENAAKLVDVAIVFIVDLLTFIKSGRPMKDAPRIPEALEQGVYEVLRRQREEEVPKEGPFFTPPSDSDLA